MCFKCILNIGGTPQLKVYPKADKNRLIKQTGQNIYKVCII